MKILIGILYCIENELSECIASIENQTHQEYDYFILDNLPKKEAHHQLYSRFSSQAEQYDLFMKLDADMVLCRTTYFEEVIHAFTIDPKLALLQVAVHDFFTDQLIFGQHNYRNTIQWERRSDEIFTDKQNISEKVVNDSVQLAPAAFHCPNPSCFQAFHFGIHKAVKVMQTDASQKRENPRNIHWDNIVRTKAHFNKNKDIRLGYAILGAETAFKYRFNYKQVDYGNALLQQHFDRVKDLDLNEIERAIKINTIFGRFPSSVRLAMISLLAEQKSFLRISGQSYYRILKNMVKSILNKDTQAVR